MREVTLAAAVAILSCACGGSPEPLSPNLAARWVGTTNMVLARGSTLTGHEALTIVVTTGNTAVLEHVGPDGSASTTATGAGDRVVYSGTLICPAVALTGEWDCPWSSSAIQTQLRRWFATDGSHQRGHCRRLPLDLPGDDDVHHARLVPRRAEQSMA